MDLFDSRQADELATLLALSEHGSFASAGKMLQRHPSVLSNRLGAEYVWSNEPQGNCVLPTRDSVWSRSFVMPSV
jgi:hypothetical protein